MMAGGLETLARRVAIVLALIGALMLVGLPLADLVAGQRALAEARVLYERVSARAEGICLSGFDDIEALTQAFVERWGGNAPVEVHDTGAGRGGCLDLTLALEGELEGGGLAQLLDDFAHEPALSVHSLDCRSLDEGRMACSGRVQLQADLR